MSSRRFAQSASDASRPSVRALPLFWWSRLMRARRCTDRSASATAPGSAHSARVRQSAWRGGYAGFAGSVCERQGSRPHLFLCIGDANPRPMRFRAPDGSGAAEPAAIERPEPAKALPLTPRRWCLPCLSSAPPSLLRSSRASWRLWLAKTWGVHESQGSAPMSMATPQGGLRRRKSGGFRQRVVAKGGGPTPCPSQPLPRPSGQSLLVIVGSAPRTPRGPRTWLRTAGGRPPAFRNLSPARGGPPSSSHWGRLHGAPQAAAKGGGGASPPPFAPTPSAPWGAPFSSHWGQLQGSHGCLRRPVLPGLVSPGGAAGGAAGAWLGPHLLRRRSSAARAPPSASGAPPGRR